MVKNAGDPGLIPGLGRSLEKEWQSTMAFLPGEFHGQRSLTSYSPWGYKESDTTEQRTHACTMDKIMRPRKRVFPITIHENCIMENGNKK